MSKIRTVSAPSYMQLRSQFLTVFGIKQRCHDQRWHGLVDPDKERLARTRFAMNLSEVQAHWPEDHGDLSD